jgi:serine/threonine-protein kinase HipA
MIDELVALLAGTEIGRVQRDKTGRLTFVYDEAWRNAEGAYPLSLSMPLAAAQHGSSVIEAFLWGLLPDNEFVLGKWAQKFQVSSRNVFALIANVGEDCAGAVQFVPPDRLEAVRNGSTDHVEWIDEKAVAERLRFLKQDHSAWRLPRDTGQFSLAGAQPKTALLYEDGKWGVPSGRIPTTHILKPPAGQFDGHAENEHICLALARSLGLPAAHSEVLHFEDEVAIVVERYDRVRSGNDILRVHQEDMCQALGVPPTQKYQNEKGPSTAQIAELLRANSTNQAADVETFVRALVFNWLIAGSDAHAKNYSVLLGGGPRIRLAPLYDLVSILPYEQFDLRKVKFAMKIGGEYQLEQIGPRQWDKFAREMRIDADQIFGILSSMAAAILDHLADLGAKARVEALSSMMIERIVTSITSWTKQCAKVLGFDISNNR